MTPMDLQTLARAALVPARTEARTLFDDGETRAAIAAHLGLDRSTVEHLTRAPAPRLPAWTADQLARLPAHVRQMIQGGTNA